MKVSSKTEYALLALVYLARNYHLDKYISAEVIANAQKIPLHFLEQILLTLKRAHCLRSFKGPKGGFCLAKSADKITLAEVIRLFDGAIAPTVSVSEYFYQPTPIEKEKKIAVLFREIRDLVSKRMEETTVADLL